MKPLIFSLVLLPFLLPSCSEEEPEHPKQMEEVFPSDADVTGYWMLNRVLLDDVEVLFDNRELNLENEYFRISADKTTQHITQLHSYIYADNYDWSLEKDLLRIGGLHGLVYKVQSFSDSQLVMSPNSRQNLELEFNGISAADFPEFVFAANVAGEVVNGPGGRARLLDATIDLIGGTDSFDLFIDIPGDAASGQVYVKPGGTERFGALILKGDAEYGTLVSGTLKVIERRKDYIHVEFELTVRDNHGTEEISVTDGTISAILTN